MSVGGHQTAQKSREDGRGWLHWISGDWVRLTRLTPLIVLLPAHDTQLRAMRTSEPNRSEKRLEHLKAAAKEAGVKLTHQRLEIFRVPRFASILAVFENLRRASQENHLPAFRRGASRGEGGRGPGRGRGPS